jgi:ribosome-associated protein
MIRINARISLDEREIHEDFIRASGPGGQNVNKVSTAVQLRFDVARSPSLPADVRERLIVLAGRRITNDGVLVIDTERFRSQQRNRDDALQRLIALIDEACVVAKIRRATRRRGKLKRLRAPEV